MNPNNNVNGVFYDSNGNPIVKITSISFDDLPNNPVPILTSEEEFSCAISVTDETEAALWACFEGLEIIDGGKNNV